MVAAMSIRSLSLGFACATALVLAGCGGGRHRQTGQGGSPSGTAPSQSSNAPESPSLEQQFVRVVKDVQPEVVQIRTSNGLGSGVVFDTSGNIVTNAHVVASGGSLGVTLSDGHSYTAKLVGSYVPDDLAVITIGSGRGTAAATFADSSKVEVGDIVLAVGNPLGLQSSVTDGIVSAVGRDVSEGGGVVLPNAIQTSAAINPGNSGGALVDLDGRVIGIPTLAATDPRLGGAAAGIGFAIPSNIVKDIAGQIVQHGKVVNSHRAALGVSLADNPDAPGAVVTAVQPGGPAAMAGIAAGDTINAIDGKSVGSADALATILATMQPGRIVEVAAVRPDGASSKHTVTLGELPGS